MAVESVAECVWNGWPNQRGISGRMVVEWVAEWVWNTQFILGDVAFIGFGGIFLIRKIINSYVKKKVQLAIDSKSLLVQMQVATHTGYQQYLDYVEADEKYIWQLESAIRKTRWAIHLARKFSQKKLKALTKNSKKDLHYSVLGQAKNNLCYHLVSPGERFPETESTASCRESRWKSISS